MSEHSGDVYFHRAFVKNDDLWHGITSYDPLVTEFLTRALRLLPMVPRQQGATAADTFCLNPCDYGVFVHWIHDVWANRKGVDLPDVNDGQVPTEPTAPNPP